MIAIPPAAPELEDARWMIEQASASPVRTMREFAEAEIVLPDGPAKGQRYRAERQPFAALWFDQVEEGTFIRFATTGCAQSGKTLLSFVIPILHALFELGETIVVGVTDKAMAMDKWREDIEPVIDASPRLLALKPEKGAGSRGGEFDAIKFRNGATMRFMTGNQGDEGRSAFTARHLAVTEADKMDTAAESSRESDPISQMQARTQAFGWAARHYIECTVSTVDGRISQEIANGSDSRIVKPCPHCGEHVNPGREDLVGWKDAKSDFDAAEAARWKCPDCATVITEEERVAMLRRAVVLHKGQTIDADGTVHGDPPRTWTLGFRWNAFDNLFFDAAIVARAEWQAARKPDPEAAEREMCQFFWSTPIEPPKLESVPLDVDAISRRTSTIPRGFVPNGTEVITVGADVGRYFLHWLAIAWGPSLWQVIDYGTRTVPTRDMGEESAMLFALRQWREEIVEQGWGAHGDAGELVHADRAWIDSGYQGRGDTDGEQASPVYAFTEESGARYESTKGFGTTGGRAAYGKPKTKTRGGIIVSISEGYHVVRLKSRYMRLVHLDADHWKHWLHRRLRVEIGKPGALQLYNAPPAEHHQIARHFCAERMVEEFRAGTGVVRKFEQINRQNHYLDAAAIACAAAHSAGVRIPGLETQEERENNAGGVDRPRFGDPRRNSNRRRARR